MSDKKDVSRGDRRWTRAAIKKAVEIGLVEDGARGVTVVGVRWLGQWSAPRIGPGPDFRRARVELAACRVRFFKTVTVERDGSWSVR